MPCITFKRSIHQRIMGGKYNVLDKKILSSTTVFNIYNKNTFFNEHIRINSEESCNTEDCSNG